MSGDSWREAEEGDVCLVVAQSKLSWAWKQFQGLELAARWLLFFDAPAPRNLTKLKSLLGLVTYYRMLVPGIATILLHFIASCRSVHHGSLST